MIHSSISEQELFILETYVVWNLPPLVPFLFSFIVMPTTHRFISSHLLGLFSRLEVKTFWTAVNFPPMNEGVPADPPTVVSDVNATNMLRLNRPLGSAVVVVRREDDL